MRAISGKRTYDKGQEKPETFSDYNQGWNDACAYIRDKLKSAQAADAVPIDYHKKMFGAGEQGASKSGEEAKSDGLCSNGTKMDMEG